MSRTAAGLRSLDHEVSTVEQAPADARFDLLHAFTSEPHVWHMLQHWTRNQCPLVVTSIVVVSPGRTERLMRLGARLPAPLTSVRMKREVLQRAAAVIAATRYESQLVVTGFGVPPDRVSVIGNGADPIDGDEPRLPPGLPSEPFVLLVGGVSRRKRQAEVIRALGREPPVVVAGPFLGGTSERREWEAVVREGGALWLGPVEPKAIRALQRRALAQVLLSDAEAQSLAVVEALAAGTPVVVSDIPSHRELHDAYPSRVHLVRDPSECAAAISSLRTAGRPPGPPPAVPSWRDVAARIADVYRRVLE
jgi:glycosyltransferase involved in cell wall biosynthesis